MRTKGQTKSQSLFEAVTNTSIGFLISLGATFVIFPVMGIESSAGKNFVITCFFTVVSVLRGYLLRRLFNNENNQ